MATEYLTPKSIEVPLTQGYIATIDPEDVDLLQYVWHALKSNKNVYACRNSFENGKRIHIRMHRVILSRQLGRELTKEDCVDHEDGNGCNNSRKNLRLASQSQNSKNRKLSKNNTTGYKGVDFQKRYGKWRARICVNYESVVLGVFDSPEDAYRAYCEASVKYHGEFANNGSVSNDPLVSEQYDPEAMKFSRRKFGESNQRGVHKTGNTWSVRIKINGKTVHFGSFNTIEEATIVYNQKTNELYGIES